MGHDQNLRDCNFTFHHFREPRTPWMTIFPIFCDFEWEKKQNVAWFLVKWLELREWGMNGIPQFRNEVKCDFREMVTIAFEREFSDNVNLLTQCLKWSRSNLEKSKNLSFWYIKGCQNDFFSLLEVNIIFESNQIHCSK